MNLNVDFPGQTIRFEGDRTVLLRQLPAGAQVQRARITVTPEAPPGCVDCRFQEVLSFPGGPSAGDVGEFGMTKVVTSGVVEVDFHARRTLAALAGTSIAADANGAVLLVDLGGGVFMRIAQDGALATPDDDDFYNVPGSGVLPGLTVAKFRLQAAGPALIAQNLDVGRVTVRTVPTNVSLALGQEAPFWTRIGEMTTAETSDDFAQFLQLFLSEAEVVNGFYQIPLVVHSDALARLSLAVAIEYVVQESALPPGVDEVALPYGHDTVPQDGCQALEVALPAGAQVTRAAVRVLGSFESSRVAVGPTGPLTPTAEAAIRPGQGQAQPIRLTRILPVTAVDLLLSCTRQAGAVLELNVLPDVDGRPFGDGLLSPPVRLELDRDVAPRPTWLSAALPETFQFPADRVWLSVQALSGEAVWHAVDAGAAIAEADPVGLHYSAASGLGWRASHGERTAPALVNGTGDRVLAGLFRLRYEPAQYSMPLEVMVGQGDGATRVSLDRYRALGRIDFTVDFPEFAAAINRAARQGEAGGAPAGEQLRNGDFARWTIAGDNVGAPQRVPGIATATTVTIAPDGQWAYVGDAAGQGQGALAPTGGTRFLNLPDHAGAPDAALPTPPVRQLVAIRGDGERIAIVDNRLQREAQVCLVDGRARRIIGSTSAPTATCLAWSPDGRWLYVGGRGEAQGDGNGGGGQVLVFDAAAFEQAPIAQNQHDQQIVRQDTPTFDLDETTIPISLAVSPDGRRLYVGAVQVESTPDPSPDAAAAVPEGRIYAFDTATRSALPASPLVVPGPPIDLAVTPNGRWLLAPNFTGNALLAVDANRLTLAQSVPLGGPAKDLLSPIAVEVSADSGRAYVGNSAGPSISVVDLTTWRARRPIAIPTAGSPDQEEMAFQLDIALTPAGDRLYAAVNYFSRLTAGKPQSVSGLFYLTVGLPENWTLTQGTVMPLTLDAPYRLAALLGPATAEACAAQPQRPSALSQAVAATGGRTYDFSFWGIAAGAGATAEVIWRGDNCALARTDRVPVQIDEDAAIRPCPAIDPITSDDWPDLRLHRTRLVAPAGATQAEIRFITPLGKNAIIDSVSLSATAETTVNGDMLELNEDGEVLGWQLAPADALGVGLAPGADGITLSNTGSATASLVQSFAATAGQPFLLDFAGTIVTAGAGGPPSVVLAWLDAAGAPTGEVAELTLEAGQSDHRLQGTVPAGAAGAELRLQLPAGAALLVRRVTFAPVEIGRVPICFVAQAPGDIAVLDFDYSYDTPPTRPTPAPPGGLCPATPPGRRPDGQGGCACAYCDTPCGPCCDEEEDEGQATPPPAAVAVRPAAPARRATRPVVVARAQAPAVVFPAIRPAEEDVHALMAAAPTLWAARAPELAAAAAPLTLVHGIAEGRARALSELGIGALPQLAAAEAAPIASVLPGVSPAIAAGFITEAQTLLAEPAALPLPLVSCLMATSGHRAFVPQALDLFRRQDYPSRELIVVDDGQDGIEDLLPGEAEQRAGGFSIQYVRLDGRRSRGHKLNVAAARARGPILAHWDDDAWVAPERLRYQVAALIEREADACGLDNVLHYDPATGTAWQSVRPPGAQPWLAGGTLCYRGALWAARPYDEDAADADSRFLRDRPGARVLALRSAAWLVNILHSGDAGQGLLSPLWRPYPAAEVRRLLGADLAVYEQLAERVPAPGG